MRQNEALAIDTSVCLHSDDIMPQKLPLLGTPATMRPLRILDDGSLRSALFSLPQGWVSASEGVLAATTQLFVIDGALRISNRLLGSAGFAMLPAGTPFSGLVAEAGCSLLAIFDPPSFPRAIAPHVIENVEAIPPFTPTIDGRLLEGFERRVLWADPDNKADTRLLRVPAGFRGPGPNWHPVQEEIFCLEGDIQPDDSRPMRAGSYLWNPAHSVHGFDEYTIGGCLLLEWHDGEWALTTTPDLKA